MDRLIVMTEQEEWKMDPKVHAALNQQTANWMIMFMKLHDFHWYVKGEHFFTLHAKFEELYNEAALIMDQLAERLLALGGRPVRTLRECLDTATIRESSGAASASQMVNELIADYQQICGELKQGIAAAEQQQDDSTADLFVGLHTSLQKHIWMLSAYVQQQ